MHHKPQLFFLWPCFPLILTDVCAGAAGRNLVRKAGESGVHHKLVRKEAEAAATAAAAAPAAPDATTEKGLDGAKDEEESVDDEADFGESGEDAAVGIQLEELAVSRTADVLGELGFTVDGAGFRCFLAVAKNAANGERWPISAWSGDRTTIQSDDEFYCSVLLLIGT